MFDGPWTVSGSISLGGVTPWWTIILASGSGPDWTSAAQHLHISYRDERGQPVETAVTVMVVEIAPLCAAGTFLVQDANASLACRVCAAGSTTGSVELSELDVPYSGHSYSSVHQDDPVGQNVRLPTPRLSNIQVHASASTHVLNAYFPACDCQRRACY
eukprot:509553-Rhodomonas_salina.2